MTERKPPGVSFESWVDRQIREATERGAFDDLPGAGKPLAGERAPYDEQWWLREKMVRESLSYLPPSLALRKEADDARAAAASARTEREVRRIVAEINEKIAEAIRTPPAGPPHNLVPFDAEEIVREWREALRRRL
ncbi:DnaJ family domain-containing protein [Streptomyces daliensis]